MGRVRSARCLWRAVLFKEVVTMPLYDFGCAECGKETEAFIPIDAPTPSCCGKPMTRRYTVSAIKVKWGPEPWMNRMDDIHKAQADRGERLRLPHPKEIRAT